MWFVSITSHDSRGVPALLSFTSSQPHSGRTLSFALTVLGMKRAVRPGRAADVTAWRTPWQMAMQIPHTVGPQAAPHRSRRTVPASGTVAAAVPAERGAARSGLGDPPAVRRRRRGVSGRRSRQENRAKKDRVLHPVEYSAFSSLQGQIRPRQTLATSLAPIDSAIPSTTPATWCRFSPTRGRRHISRNLFAHRRQLRLEFLERHIGKLRESAIGLAAAFGDLAGRTDVVLAPVDTAANLVFIHAKLPCRE